MYELIGKESFDSAHYLRGHDGKCRNLHGHRWDIEYCIESDILYTDGAKTGMMSDFSDVKKLIKGLIDEYDHSLLLEEPQTSEEKQFIEACKNMEFKVIELPFRTTAENLSKYFYEKLTEIFKNLDNPNNIRVGYVRIYETPNNSVRYKA